MATISSKHAHPELLDVPAAAAYLGVGQRFIRRLAAERRIPFHKVGRHVRFATDDLDRFIAAGRIDATSTHGKGRT